MFTCKKHSYCFPNCLNMQNAVTKFLVFLLLGWLRTERGTLTFSRLPNSNFRLTAVINNEITFDLYVFQSWVGLTVFGKFVPDFTFVTKRQTNWINFVVFYSSCFIESILLFFLLVYRSLESCSKTENVSRRVKGREENKKNQKLYNASMIISYHRSRLHCNSRHFYNCADWQHFNAVTDYLLDFQQF